MGPYPTSLDTRCHFFRIPLELRDDIYDYVAYGKKNLGLHVNTEVPTEPKLHCYDERLSRTCTQIRQEYTIRLEPRIKQLVMGHRLPVAIYGWTRETFTTLCSVLRSQIILIAEREVLQGAWVQVDVASRSFIAFRGLYDEGWYAGILTFTLASSAVRGYNRRFGVKYMATRRVPTWNYRTAARYLPQLEDVAKPTRTTGGFSCGADMHQPMPLSHADKVVRFARVGVVGLPGFEDPHARWTEVVPV